MQVFFSIITVCYNAEQTIKDTLESLCNQNFKNLEYLVIDGASTDGTLDTIRAYEHKFKQNNIRFVYVSEPDKGMYDAMNKGISMAKGTLIGILNSDDWYEPTALQTIYSLYSNTEKKGLYCGQMHRVNHKKEPYKTLNNNRKIRRTIALKMPINHPATFVHREVYKAIGKFDTSYRLSADYDFVFRAFKAGIPFVFSDSILTNMRNSGATGVLSNLWVTAKENYYIRKKHKVFGAEIYYLKRVVFNCLIILRAFIRDIIHKRK